MKSDNFFGFIHMVCLGLLAYLVVMNLIGFLSITNVQSIVQVQALITSDKTVDLFLVRVIRGILDYGLNFKGVLTAIVNNVSFYMVGIFIVYGVIRIKGESSEFCRSCWKDFVKLIGVYLVILLLLIGVLWYTLVSTNSLLIISRIKLLGYVGFSGFLVLLLLILALFYRVFKKVCYNKAVGNYD